MSEQTHHHHECGHPDHPKNVGSAVYNTAWWVVSRYIPFWVIVGIIALILPTTVLAILIPIAVVGALIWFNRKPRR